jgi:hypothetical protein
MYVYIGLLPGEALDELHVLDLGSSSWIALSAPAAGPWPSSRYNHGFTSASEMLYLFGGMIHDTGAYFPVFHTVTNSSVDFI